MRSKLFALALFAYGCTGTTNNYYILDGGAPGGGGDGGQLCTPGAKDCVTSTLARICSPDGNAWIGLPCATGLTCSKGDCVFDASNTSCTPGQSACASNTALGVCNAAGTAFTMMNCPSGTVCGNGLCIGACIVGESKCDATGTVVLTCSDGHTFTPSPCPAMNFCVNATGTSPAMSFCIPATVCQPDPGGCNTVCGDKTNPANDQTKYTSTCVPTASGYAWQVTQCPSTQSCSPSGGPSCGTNPFAPLSQAGCLGICVPGQTRCGADGVSTQVCDSTGNWGATTACDATTGQICFFIGNQATCGDLICAYKAKGVCVQDMGISKLRACVNGKLATDGTTCAMGLCGPDTSVMVPPGLPQPGACLVQCKTGDLKCANNALQGCSANGTWNTMTTPCATGTACFDNNSPTGRPAAACGVCLPGSHQCTNSTGTMGVTGGYIEACGANAMWGAPTACATGHTCAATASDNACQQQCVPGSKLCFGTPLTVGGNAIAGTSQGATCPPSGLLADATPTNCPSGQSCRKDQAGNPLGCVVCVGGMNENGLVDTRCSVAGGGGPGTADVQTCKSDSSAWDTANLMSCSPKTCVNADPKTSLYGCGDCPGYPGIFCSNSNLAAYGTSCGNLFGTGAAACGKTPDCCTNACIYPTNNPAPATCQ